MRRVGLRTSVASGSLGGVGVEVRKRMWMRRRGMCVYDYHYVVRTMMLCFDARRRSSAVCREPVRLTADVGAPVEVCRMQYACCY